MSRSDLLQRKVFLCGSAELHWSGKRSVWTLAPAIWKMSRPLSACGCVIP